MPPPINKSYVGTRDASGTVRGGRFGYPAGVAPTTPRPSTTGNLTALAGLIAGAPVNQWIDTGLKPGTAWAVRSMIAGARDAIESDLGTQPGEANANFTKTASDTLLNSNGVAYFKAAQQIYFHGGGHGGWPGNEVYRIDLQSMTWGRQTDPSPMQRNPDGTWRNLDNTPVSAHTYNGITAAESLGCFFLLTGSPWPLGGFTNELWKFDINTSQWTFLRANPMGRNGAPHAIWVEERQALLLAKPQWCRWYYPATDTLGPVLDQFSAFDRGNVGMTVIASQNVYGFSHTRMDRLPLNNVGLVNFSNVTDAWPQFTSYSQWSRVLHGWNSYMWDAIRQLMIVWDGGSTNSQPGTRLWGIDFANGRLYQFPMTGIPSTGTALGAFTKLIHIAELDCYLMLANSASVNGWMAVKPGSVGSLTLVAS